MNRNNFVIFKDKVNGGYVIARKKGKYSQHAHMKSMEDCRNLLKLIEENTMPTKEWLKGSCRRLLTDQEYKKLKQKKRNYYNYPSKMRRRRR